MFLDENPGLVGVGERGGAGRGEDGEGEAGEGDCRSHLRGSDQVFFLFLQIRNQAISFQKFQTSISLLFFAH